MATYATSANFIAEFTDDNEVARVTDNTEAEGPNTAVITELLDRAQAIVDGKLAVRYAVPVDVTTYTTVHPLLRGLTIHIAVYHAVGGRNDVVSDAKKTMYESAMKYLQELHDGDADLPGVSPLPSSTINDQQGEYGFGDADTDFDLDDENGTTTATSMPRVFSRDSMRSL